MTKVRLNVPPTPPAISADRIVELAALELDWDSYGGKPPTQEALDVLRCLCVVPTSDGGVQIEWHVKGWDVEINIAPNGTPLGVFMDRRFPTPAGDES